MRADGRDEWATPVDVYEKICKTWELTPSIDVCASILNRKCPLYIDAAQDALKEDWIGFAREWKVEPIFFMNPPYSQPLMTEFIKKAIEVSYQDGITIFLLPAFPDQAWYHNYIEYRPHMFWRGRIKFDPPGGIKASSPRYGNVHGVIR